MFLHVSVILSTGGGPGPEGGCLLLGGVPAPGGVYVSCVSAPSGGAWSQGVSAPGGCLLPGGCLFLGGAWSQRGVCSWGVCSQGVSAPGGTWWRPPGMATAAGGTHPTGMHSCL